MNNAINPFNFVPTGFQRPQVSAGSAAPSGPSESVGTAEPTALPRRPQFAAPSSPSEGQRSSLGWARRMVQVLALTVACAGFAGCATVHTTPAQEPAPVAMQAGQAVRDWHQNVDKPVAETAKKAVRDWHENVDKPVAKGAKQAVQGWHEKVDKPVGNWFRDRFREFKDGVQGK